MLDRPKTTYACYRMDENKGKLLQISAGLSLCPSWNQPEASGSQGEGCILEPIPQPATRFCSIKAELMHASFGVCAILDRNIEEWFLCTISFPPVSTHFNTPGHFLFADPFPVGSDCFPTQQIPHPLELFIPRDVFRTSCRVAHPGLVTS